MIQLKQKIAEHLASKISEETKKIILTFSDNSQTDYINCSSTTSHNETDKIYYVHIYFVFTLSTSKTLTKISFYDANSVLLYEDINLSIDLPSGENHFEEKLKIQYT